MRCRFLHAFFFAVVVTASNTAAAAPRSIDDVPPTGRIIEQIACQRDPTQSYALYLPSYYKPDRAWPILYCFDYLGDGKLPAGRFMEGAERYGYIIAGSNNSKNGIVENSVAAFKAVWVDTHSRFSINDARVYTAGFSGGARIASLIGSFYRVEGVIACGAGFQLGLSPSKKTLFAYYATVGSDDFNFPELRSLEKSLNKLGVVNRLVEFDGWHTWAPIELCTRAIEWMEVQAMLRNKREKDAELIDRLFTQWFEHATQFERDHRLYESYLWLKSLAADFKGLRDVSEVEKKVSSLKDTERVKQAVRQENERVLKQKELEDEIWSYTDMLDDPNKEVAAIGRLKQRIAQLRKDFDAPEPTDRRRVVRRALTHLFEVFYERGTVKHVDNQRLAIRSLEIAIEINPADSRAPYRLACLYSIKGEKKKALAALNRAVESGFANLALLRSAPELNAIRDDPEYQRILERLKSRLVD